MSKVSAAELHEPTNDPSTLTISPGVPLTETQRRHVAIVLDIFQAKGTMAKFDDNFTQDAVYEDLFASAKDRQEVAGQLLHLPTICASAKTLSYSVASNTPSTTTDGTGKEIKADEIRVPFKHVFEFKLPLPTSARSLEINTTLLIFSCAEAGKIVRLQDRPDEDIPNSSVLDMLRKMNAVGLPKVTGLPANEKEDAEKMMKEQR